jgi:hypothetical protein
MTKVFGLFQKQNLTFSTPCSFRWFIVAESTVRWFVVRKKHCWMAADSADLAFCTLVT